LSYSPMNTHNLTQNRQECKLTNITIDDKLLVC